MSPFTDMIALMNVNIRTICQKVGEENRLPGAQCAHLAYAASRCMLPLLLRFRSESTQATGSKDGK
jgi:hypothetical protein